MKINDYIKIDPRYAESLDKSVERWERMVNYYYRGVEMKQSVLEELDTTFLSSYSGEITLTGFEAEGLCPHHFLPTHYTATLTYVPSGNKMIGTSKAYMVFRAIAAQPLLMEDIFEEFCSEFRERVKPRCFTFEMRGKYECNHKDGVSRDAEVVLYRNWFSKRS